MKPSDMSAEIERLLGVVGEQARTIEKNAGEHGGMVDEERKRLLALNEEAKAQLAEQQEMYTAAIEEKDALIKQLQEELESERSRPTDSEGQGGPGSSESGTGKSDEENS